MFVIIIANEQQFLFCRQGPLDFPSLMISANEQQCSP